jgi:general secretion pathway protein E
MTASSAILAEPSLMSATAVDSTLASERFLRSISRDFARQHLVHSQGTTSTGLERLAVDTSTNRWAIHNIATCLGTSVETFIASGEAIAAAIDAAYSAQSSAASAKRHQASDSDDLPSSIIAEEIDHLLAQSDRDLLSTQGKGPVVRLVDAILFEALQKGASDVHIQPLADRTLVRYRLDGVLHVVREFPPAATAAIVSRIKVMGRMDIAERRVPQDGRATVTLGSMVGRSDDAVSERGSGPVTPTGRAVDLRLSTMPTSYGERVVIRLLDAARQLAQFPQLGMPPGVAQRFLSSARRSHGIILVTGPTGSGKTTTLYATLREVRSLDLNVMTIEDPIGYELSTVGLAVSQAQVNLKKGVSFATGLRHILRQDPDVIMVGEIRDAETARIAIQSSLTGHLVFSTLHTNDAASAITRLVDLGVEPYLVAASLSAVLAQRLVRLIHTDCQGNGCEGCGQTGYRGRTGIFELLLMNEAIRELIAQNAALSSIRSAAQANGLCSLRDEGDRLIREGRTSLLEVERVVQGVGEEIEG